MRALLAGERTTLALQALAFHVIVEVENADGIFIDVSSRFVSADITTDIDQPVWSATIAFARDDQPNTASLSPLRSDSTLNVDNSAAYAPLITAGRQIRLKVATLAPGATPISGDYRYLFYGRIDKPNFGQTPMTVDCRDLGGQLIDTIITEKRTYGEEAGVDVEDVMQQVLDDNLGAGVVTLEVPTPTGYSVTDYTPENVSVMDALQTLALKFGGVVRYRFASDGLSKLTVYVPTRTAPSVDATIPPTEYLEIPDASIDSTNVRNKIRGKGIDPVTGEEFTVEVSDSSSINAFNGGVALFMQLGGEITSGMTANEVLAMITLALSDLKYPKFDHVVECLLFWPAEIADYYTFSANAVHYNAAQSLSVMGIAHHLEQGHGTTRLITRGTPAGAYLDWIRRQGTGPTGPQIPPAPELMFLLGEATQFGGTSDTVDGGIWFGYRMPVGVDEIRVHVLLGVDDSVGIPSIDGPTLAPVIRRPEGDIGKGTVGLENRYPNEPGEYASLSLLSTRPNMWKRIQFYGVRGGLTSVPVIWRAVQAVDPTPTRIDGTIADMDVVRSGSTNTVTVTPGTLDDGPTTNGNWLVIMRNEHILPPFYIAADTTPIVFEDTGLPPDESYEAVYDAFIWNGGQSGPRFRAVAEAPTLVAPVWALGTPSPVIESGVPKIQLSWTGTTVGATGVRVEATLDGVAVRTVGTGALASGTVYDTDTGAKRYRLVATNGGTDIVVSPWKWSTRLPPTISNPAAVPQIVTGYPRVGLAPGTNIFDPELRLVIKWTCATPGAAQVRVQESDDNGVGDPWATSTNGTSASVASGTWYSPNDTPIAIDRYYRVQALNIVGTVLATSTAVHYIPAAT